MKILINAEADKMELYTRSTGTAFLPLKGSGSTGDAVAVVVRGSSFQKDLETSVALNVPVVVVAGSDSQAGQNCAQEAVRWGIPEACILLKKGDKVCSLDGREIADAVRGIGVRAVLKAAQYALENKLYPEPLIWQEDEEEPVVEEDPDPVLFEEPEQPAERQEKPPKLSPVRQEQKNTGNNVVRLSRGSDAELRVEGVLEMSRKVAVVLKATPDADSGKVAGELAEKLSGVHFEISGNPESYRFYGETLEKAAESGKYMACTGNSFIGTGYMSAEWLIVELDAAVLTAMPNLVDAIYRKAEKVIQVVGGFKEGRSAVKTWLDSGWKLDAVIPGAAFEKFKDVFGELVFPDAAALAAQFP